MGENQNLFIGNTPLKSFSQLVTGEFVSLFGEPFYKIANYDQLEPFFMSLVSSSDHWLFVSSTGGLTAGRGSPEQALFPYYTDDKLAENAESTGSKTILWVSLDDRKYIWEPFSCCYRASYRIVRNIYKNVPGTTLLFEELNNDLGLVYRYSWRTTEKFGFIKTSYLANVGNTARQVELLDGLQNLLPANVPSNAQLAFGSLVNAYKRSELDPLTGLAIYSLNSVLSDLPEPGESLLATTVFQLGLHPDGCLLSSAQMESFRQGSGVMTETEVRGSPGAYFVHAHLELVPGQEFSWHLVADVSRDSCAVTETLHRLHGDYAALIDDLESDIAINQVKLRKIVASADGLQLTNSMANSAHHFANVLFNVMRGGVFADQYWIDARDFKAFVFTHNRLVGQDHSDTLASLPEKIQLSALISLAEHSGSPDLIRLSYSYLPLVFSRRHGDPTRPWNRFSISLKNQDGSPCLGYEGNWRDIFQNWEALAYSYPEFVESMLSTFLNATTPDGYNPYRVTGHGIDWEVPEAGNPWANIGYWSDHQVIYLQKLMEISSQVHPGRLQGLLDRPVFSYANVPYRLKSYPDLLQDPFHTIVFDWDMQNKITQLTLAQGSDGKLVHQPDGRVLQVSMAEKLLTILLAKLANFVPDGGIWMVTQRPEWNDANNALVGKGLSVVTLCYLRRFIAFCLKLFEDYPQQRISICTEVSRFFDEVNKVLLRYQHLLAGNINDEDRRAVMDALGEAGSIYRWGYYENGYSGQKTQLEISRLADFLALVQQYADHSLHANLRTDHLYHAYNILHLGAKSASISPLYEMLEGQVAILSSGLLTAGESLALLDSLKLGPLYQADRNSYILYPDHAVPGFLAKNRLAADQVKELRLITTLVNSNDRSLIVKDIDGYYHFNGHFRNASDVRQALGALRQVPQYVSLVASDSAKILDLFEQTFHHDQFTGRAGTFFAYEGLGSVYWHMVSKLLLAVQETALRFRQDALAEALVDRYFDIRTGLGFNKSPSEFGAFPTDPYSHTPRGHGARQPGMTGQVKEEILTRLSELGLTIRAGQLNFDPFMIVPGELLTTPEVFSWLDVNGQDQSIELSSGSLAYSFCQVPVILQSSNHDLVEVHKTDGSVAKVVGHALDAENSRHIFMRDGTIHHLLVQFHPEK